MKLFTNKKFVAALGSLLAASVLAGATYITSVATDGLHRASKESAQAVAERRVLLDRILGLQRQMTHLRRAFRGRVHTLTLVVIRLRAQVERLVLYIVANGLPVPAGTGGTQPPPRSPPLVVGRQRHHRHHGHPGPSPSPSPSPSPTCLLGLPCIVPTLP